jgi:hypothetical protein
MHLSTNLKISVAVEIGVLHFATIHEQPFPLPQKNESGNGCSTIIPVECAEMGQMHKYFRGLR